MQTLSCGDTFPGDCVPKDLLNISSFVGEPGVDFTFCGDLEPSLDVFPLFKKVNSTAAEQKNKVFIQKYKYLCVCSFLVHQQDKNNTHPTEQKSQF